MSFLVFGGISLLDNVLSGSDIPLVKIVITGSIWSLCMVNLIFIFVYFVNRILSNLNQGKHKNLDCEKFIKNVNFLFITIFLLAVVVRIMETDKLIYYNEQLSKGGWIVIKKIVVAVIIVYFGANCFFVKKNKKK